MAKKNAEPKQGLDQVHTSSAEELTKQINAAIAAAVPSIVAGVRSAMLAEQAAGPHTNVAKTRSRRLVSRLPQDDPERGTWDAERLTTFKAVRTCYVEGAHLVGDQFITLNPKAAQRQQYNDLLVYVGQCDATGDEPVIGADPKVGPDPGKLKLIQQGVAGGAY